MRRIPEWQKGSSAKVFYRVLLFFQTHPANQNIRFSHLNFYGSLEIYNIVRTRGRPDEWWIFTLKNVPFKIDCEL